MSWLTRLVNALHSRRLDEDLAEEMRDHLELRTAALRDQGLEPAEARRQARLRFRKHHLAVRRKPRHWSVGATGRCPERCLLWLARHAQESGLALTAVLSLGLAIGATTAVYSIVDAAILRPLPVPHAGRLVMLAYPGISDPGNANPAERQSFSYPEFLQFASVAQPVARLGLFSSPERVEGRSDDHDAPVERISRAYVSGQAFDILGVRAAVGRLFSVEQDRFPQSRPSAVLSYDYWQRRFHGDPAVLGRSMVIAGKLFEIAGVAQKGFFGVEPGWFADVWVPGTTYEARALTDPGWHWFRILGRLASEAAPQQLQARLQPSFHDFQVVSTQRDTNPFRVHRCLRFPAGFCTPVVDRLRSGSRNPADRLRKRCQPAAGSRDRAGLGNGHANFAGSRAVAACTPDVDRKLVAVSISGGAGLAPGPHGRTAPGQPTFEQQ